MSSLNRQVKFCPVLNYLFPVSNHPYHFHIHMNRNILSIFSGKLLGKGSSCYRFHLILSSWPIHNRRFAMIFLAMPEITHASSSATIPTDYLLAKFGIRCRVTNWIVFGGILLLFSCECFQLNFFFFFRISTLFTTVGARMTITNTYAILVLICPSSLY